MKSFSYAEEGLKLAEKVKWKKGIANLHNNLGLYISDTGNSALARKHFEQSYTLNKELDSKFNLINNLNNIGRSYWHESDYPKAIEYYFRALAIAQATKNNEQIALVGTNLTAIFTSQENYAKAEEYAKMTIKHGELSNAPNHLGKGLTQLGNIKMATNDSAAAKVYLGKALKVYEDIDNKPAIAVVMSSMASLEYPNHKQAIEIRLKVQEIMDEISPSTLNSMENIANLGISYYYLALESQGSEKVFLLNKSETSLLRAETWSRQSGDPDLTAKIALAQAHLKEEKGDYKAALNYYKTYNATNDSLFSQEKKNEIAGLEGKHNIALKDDEIAINKLMLSNQRQIQIGLIVGLFLAAVIGGLLYWQSRNRKKTNTTLMVLNNQLDEANKVKAKFFGILSHDLRGPVANLIHFLDIQKSSPDLLSAEQRNVHQQRIERSAEDLLNNMEAMLLWSKEQMQNFKPNIENVAVSDLFDYLRKFFGQTEQINIVFDHSPGLVVSTDENYLRVIMQNLTANAIKAINNIPNAVIEWKAKKEGNKTILSITDNGPGISDEQAKALFDDNIVANSKNGFGLHLIKDLAKAIRYKISVQSQWGQGTTFVLEQV